MLTNGNSGKIQIPTVYENAMVIPQGAMFEQQGNIMIFKLGEDNKVNSTLLQIKTTVDNLYVVESGLDLKDQIVVSGVGKLRNDMVITPKEVSFDSITKPIKPLFKQ